MPISQTIHCALRRTGLGRKSPAFGEIERRIPASLRHEIQVPEFEAGQPLDPPSLRMFARGEAAPADGRLELAFACFGHADRRYLRQLHESDRYRAFWLIRIW